MKKKWLWIALGGLLVKTKEDEEGRVFIFSKRDIEPGEELSYDNNLSVDGGVTKKEAKYFACRCGAQKCRGTMLADANDDKKKKKKKKDKKDKKRRKKDKGYPLAPPIDPGRCARPLARAASVPAAGEAVAGCRPADAVSRRFRTAVRAALIVPRRD